MEVFYDSDSDIMTPVDMDSVDTVATGTEEPGKNGSEEPTEVITDDNIASDEVIVADLSSIDKETDEGDEVKVIGKGKTPSSKASSSSSSPPYSVLAKALYEEGVLTDFDEAEFDKLVTDTGSASAALIELHRRTIDSNVESWKKSLNEKQQEYLDALESGVPHDRIIQLQVATDRLDSITEDKVDADDNLAKDLYRQLLVVRNFTKEEVDLAIQEAETLDKLKEKGKIALKLLKEQGKQTMDSEKQAGKALKKANEDIVLNQMNTLKTRLDGLKELSPTQKLSEPLKKKIYEAVTVPVAIDKDTGTTYSLVGKKRAENPTDFDIRLAYLIVTGQFDGNLKNVTASAKTKAIEELDRTLSSTGISTTGYRPAKAADSKDKPSSGETLESIRRSLTH